MEVTNKKYYHCSVCGRVSTSEQKIKNCEESHIKIDIEKPLITDYARTRVRYPVSIGVPMQNGKIAYYQFTHDKEASDGG